MRDQQACDLMGAAEGLYQIYLWDPPLVKDATMEMYGVLNEYVNQFAAERGVRFETQSRSQYASASQ